MASVSLQMHPRFYHAVSTKSSNGPASATWRGRPGESFERHPVEPWIAARMKAEVAHLWTDDDPVQARVERNPGQLLREHRLSSHVQPLALGPKGELAGANQE